MLYINLHFIFLLLYIVLKTKGTEAALMYSKWISNLSKFNFLVKVVYELHVVTVVLFVSILKKKNKIFEENLILHHGKHFSMKQLSMLLSLNMKVLF